MRQQTPMTGLVAALFRHPVKGFTPEPVTSARLTPGEPFPSDRIWAVENGYVSITPLRLDLTDEAALARVLARKPAKS